MARYDRKNTEAFTLLEMLLVLAVMSVLALAGLAAYQQRLQSFKAEKTALQMQEIMEAGQAFYIDHSSNPPAQRWPAVESDFTNYLSGTVLHNCPWSYAAGTTCYSISSPPAGTSFSVSVTIPPPPAQANATQIAQMIASRLPNASISGTTVTATISKLPVGVSAPPPGFSIIGIASVYNGMVLPLHPDRCDAGLNHNVYFMMSNFAGCGYEGAPGTDCNNATIGLGTIGDNAFGFQTLPEVQPGVANPAFHLTSSVTNPTGTSLTVSMGGQYGSGLPGDSFVNYAGYHISGVAIETCEPVNASGASDQALTPPKFY